LKIFIKKPFERVKGLILGSPLKEIFEIKNVASNQTPQITPMLKKKESVPSPPWPYEFMN
jgi:hypothetical protein